MTHWVYRLAYTMYFYLRSCVYGLPMRIQPSAFQDRAVAFEEVLRDSPLLYIDISPTTARNPHAYLPTRVL